MRACFNCKKPVELAKLRLHESTCKRMTFKCSKCNEMIPKCEEEQHEFEVHNIVIIILIRPISRFNASTVRISRVSAFF